MYASQQKVGAFAETISRQFFEQRLSSPKILYWSRYSDRVITRVVPKQPLKVLDFTDNATQARLGATAQIMHSDDYSWTRKWACLSYNHPQTPQGIRYTARHAASTHSIAIFDRFGEVRFERKESIPLTPKEIPCEILEYLDRAGFITC